MSEREGPQREWGATRAEERGMSEREGPQREWGATRVVRLALAPVGRSEERT